MNADEIEMIESRFITKKFAEKNYPNTLQIFFLTENVDSYNRNKISSEHVIDHIATDIYTGCTNNDQLVSMRNKVHKLKLKDTGGLPYILKLLVGIPYMIRTNINVIDGLVNGRICYLKYIEYHPNVTDGINR